MKISSEGVAEIREIICNAYDLNSNAAVQKLAWGMIPTSILLFDVNLIFVVQPKIQKSYPLDDH